jgi:hypothetical protein
MTKHARAVLVDCEESFLKLRVAPRLCDPGDPPPHHTHQHSYLTVQAAPPSRSRVAQYLRGIDCDRAPRWHPDGADTDEPHQHDDNDQDLRIT